MTTNSTFSKIQYEEKAGFDEETFLYYKKLIKLRKSSKAFTSGEMNFIHEWDHDGILAYTRSVQKEKFLILGVLGGMKAINYYVQASMLLHMKWLLHEDRMQKIN